MANSNRVTIHELAKRSGVSVGTVSRALNGYADVKTETRERVMRIAQELDYTPNAAARTLVTQRSHVVGVFLETGPDHPDIQHPFLHEVLVGVKNRLGQGGFDLLLFASEHPGNGFGAHSYLKRCRHHHVDGAVLMGAPLDDPELDRLARSSLPCVAVDLELEGTGVTSVRSDSKTGAFLAVEHLKSLGHTKIAHISGPVDTTPGRERLNGFQKAIADLSLPYHDDYVVYGDFYYDSGKEAMQRLMSLKEPPTAVFAASDMMAMGAMRAIQAAGKTVPDDVAVVGFDDMQMAAMAHPPLTTVRQQKTRLGELAAEALLKRIEAAPGAEMETRMTLPVDLVARESTLGERD